MRSALKEAGEQFADEVIERIKKTTRFIDKTANLRGGVGVNRRVAASKRNLGLTVDPTLVRSGGAGELVIIIPSAMEYSQEVEDRTHFMAETMESDFPTRTWKRLMDDAMAGVNRVFGKK